MDAIFTTRKGLFALLIRRKEGGDESHCAVRLEDGRIVDATFLHGVSVWSEAEFFKKHRLIAQYPMHLPNPAAAEAWLLARVGWRYDVLRIIGYVLWRTLSLRRALTCDEALQGARDAGGVKLDGRQGRPGVRLLREVCASRALAMAEGA